MCIIKACLVLGIFIIPKQRNGSSTSEMKFLVLLTSYIFLLSSDVHARGCDNIFPGTPTFGSSCQFRCHCDKDGECSNTNNCINNACEKGWMGPKCQYRNVLTNFHATNQEGENFHRDSDLAVDGNKQTCSETSQSNHDGRHAWKVQLLRKHRVVGMKIYIQENDLDNFRQFRVETGPSITSFPDLCYEHPNKAGETVMEIICNIPLVTQNIRIVLNSENVPLRLCEVEVYGGRDIAFNMPTEQSTDDGSWVSSRAVDGRYPVSNDSFNEETMCSKTSGNENNPWLKIDLKQQFVIKDISFFGRHATVENSKGFYISIGNSSSTTLDIFHDDTDISDPTFYMPRNTEFTTAFNAKFVKVDLRPYSGTVSLSVCELNIFADCLPNKCGWDCSKICHCSGETTGAMKIDGVCPYGCSGRWTGIGGKCDKECNNTSWGERCQEKCGHCFESPCEARSGFCKDGCNGPWIPPMCTESCTDGTFGLNCERKCGHCISGTVCAKESGVCSQGCEPGWQGSLCETPCDEGSHGAGCMKACGKCINNTACNRHSGECEQGCHPGFDGTQCDKDLNFLARIKDSVTVTMSSVYSTWRARRAIDGSLETKAESCQCCSGTRNAKTSWWKVDMKKMYPIRKIIVYGRTNENRFQQLIGFKVVLQNRTVDKAVMIYTNRALPGGTDEISLRNILTRYIKIERPGKLTICEVRIIQGDCQIGRFGEQCSQMCHCADKRPCDRTTGTCMSAVCEIGYTGAACDKDCPATYFGQDCDRKCFCYNGVDCTKDYGICPGDCAQGYTGQHCENVCSDGWYGFKCSQKCGKCKNDQTCDNVNGICRGGCKPGYDGLLCDHALNLLERINSQVKARMSSTFNGWGANRAIDMNIGPDPSKCQCCSSTLNGASAFWHVDLGKQYPINRVEVFPRNQEALIHQLEGFQLVLKNMSSENGIIVYTNEYVGEKAYINISVSDVLAKIIEVRRAGKLTICEVKAYEGVCRLGHYGEECESTCHCADKQACERGNGACVSPVCTVGWRGSACNKVCQRGYYGHHCASKCKTCDDGSSCDPETGNCPNEDKVSSDSTQIFANVVWVSLVSLLLKMMGSWCLRVE